MPRPVMAPDTPWTVQPLTPVIARHNLAEAFIELREPVCRYLLALGLGRPEAEEVAQETFLRLCQHLDAGGPQANVRGWVFRVAHNLARDEYRRRQRRQVQPLDAGEGSAQDGAADPEQQAVARQRTLRLQTALARLPVRQRECLHLRAEGLRYREIAEVLGAGVSTVAEWVQQGLKTLVKECDENQR
jgi:RNA polymerase sigma-70 factor (ECF subfamily)